MKKVLNILILLAVLGAIAYQYRDVIRDRLPPAMSHVIAQLGIIKGPCESPIAYSLGTFDTQFGISQNYFLSALTDAEMIWEKSFGKELFAYQSEGNKNNTLKINLIYDFRQEATNKLTDLGITVKDNRASYDALKVKFTDLKAKFAAAKKDYDARLQSFNAKEKTYGEQVAYWNAQGGAPENEYNQLQAQKSTLDAEFSDLQAKQAHVNELVTEVNALVVVLNRLAGTLNISVDKYNTIGASRGESFEEGVYQSDGVNEEIDIYEFSSREKLVRVLAHELGHALGLEHVDDPKAIMYKLNQGNNKTLTAADLAVLTKMCGAQ